MMLERAKWAQTISSIPQRRSFKQIKKGRTDDLRDGKHTGAIKRGYLVRERSDSPWYHITTD